MSLPRCIRTGQVWMVTRRTTRRHFLLRPDADGMSQRIYWYTTAVLAEKFGIELHAVQVLSTHMHEVLTDVRGNLPAFIRERNRALANALKCHRKWPEEVFQRAPANCVQVLGEAAVLKEIAYVLANCVKAGLVESPEQWRGVGVTAADIGKRVVRVKRPPLYFDPRNPVWPDEAEIAIAMPASVRAAFCEQASATIQRVVRSAVANARKAVRRAGRLFSTMADVFATPFARRSSSFESFGGREPTFATGGQAENAVQARSQRRAFLDAYRSARRAMKDDEPCHFPEGTWRWLVELLPQRFQCQTGLSAAGLAAGGGAAVSGFPP